MYYSSIVTILSLPITVISNIAISIVPKISPDLYFRVVGFDIENLGFEDNPCLVYLLDYSYTTYI